MEGRTLGPYRLDRELGTGGMGKVYLATLTESVPPSKAGDRIAVKVVHPHLLSRRGFFKRFLREAEVGRRVRHENVVATLDMDALEVDGVTALYLAMEYVEGRTLRELLADLRTVPESLLREIARQVAAGLAAVHEAGIVHRDMKPENVLITEDHRVRIMDLGVARLVEESVAVTRDGEFAGSLLYAAPEQFRKGEIGPAADLYSLGVLLYELATGDNPFRRDDSAQVVGAHLSEAPRPLSEVNSEVSPFLSEVVGTLLAKEPGDRFESAAVVSDLLEEAEGSDWWAERRKVVKQLKGHLPKIPVRRETRLYGREEEFEALREAWRQAREGRGSTVLLEGEMGIGKSRLADAFLADLEGEDAHVLYGSYPPSGGMGGLSDAIIGHFGATGLASALAPYLTVTPSLVPAFAAMVQHETPPTGSEALAGDALHAVLCHLVRALAAEKPVLWIVDDLQYARPDSRQIILAVARAIAEHRVLLLGTTEPGLPEDEVSHFSRLPNFRRLPLARLSARQVIEVLRDAFRSEALAEKLGGRIAYKSDGVPFFVFEMVRGLKDGSFLRQEADGTWVQTQVIEEIEVPSAVRDLVEGRLRELTKDERALLDIAAVQGFEFDPDLVARVREAKRIHVLETLADLERRSGVVRAAGRACRFDHHQIEQVIYSALPEWLREEYHALLADAYAGREGVAGTDPEDLPGEKAVFLARHHLRGSRPADAIPFLEPALTHLEKAYRHEEALDLAGRALDTGGLLDGVERVDVLLRKVERLAVVGRRGEGRPLLDEALELADAAADPLRRCRARLAMGSHVSTSDPEGAIPWIREAADLAREAQDKQQEGRSVRGLSLVYWLLGRYDEHREHEQRSLALFREIEDRAGEAHSLTGLGNHWWTRGRYDEARRHYLEALAIARETGDRDHEALLLMNLGVVSLSLGRFEEAEEWTGRAVEEARATGSRGIEAHCAAVRGDLFLSTGFYEKALKAQRRCIAISREMGDANKVLLALVVTSQHLVTLGGLEEVAEGIEEARGVQTEVGDRRALAAMLLCEAALAEGKGSAGEAARIMEEALGVYREMRYPSGVADSLLGLGRLRLESGAPDDARPLLEGALAVSREIGQAEAEVCSLLYLALLPNGDVAPALASFEEHEPRLLYRAKLEARFLLWRATKDPIHLEEAWKLLSFARDHSPEEYRETMIANVPLHRDIAAAAATGA